MEEGGGDEGDFRLVDGWVSVIPPHPPNHLNSQTSTHFINIFGSTDQASLHVYVYSYLPIHKH